MFESNSVHAFSRALRLAPYVLAAFGAAAHADAQLGTPYCDAVANSTGRVATCSATGSPDVADRDVTLHCDGLLVDSFGYFLASDMRGFVPGVGGGVGNLCLGGAIGRYAGDVQRADIAGRVSMALDLDAVAHPVAPLMVLNGTTLHFQYTYRDSVVGGGATTNFSRGLSIAFCPRSLYSDQTMPVATGSSSFALTDLGSDGVPDVLVGTYSGALWIYIGRGDGTFDEGEPLIQIGVRSNDLEIADFNADGLTDIVVVGRDGVFFMQGLGGHGFAPPVLVFPITWFANAYAAHADLDGDGDLDLALTDAASRRVHVLQNDGSGGFTSAGAESFPLEPSRLALGDIDGDGDEDLAVTIGQPGQSLAAHGLYVLLNAGDGTFPVRYQYAAHYAGPVLFDDLDLDGQLDVVIGRANGAPPLSLTVLFNQGGGFLGGRVDFGTNLFAADLLTSDLDGDGDRDLVVSSYTYNSVEVFENLGAGQFSTPIRYRVGGNNVSLIQAADVDADGDVDVAALLGTTGAMKVLVNTGNGAFETEPRIDALGSVVSIDSGDLDGDGLEDLLVVRESGSRIEFLRGLGAGAFGPPTLVPTQRRSRAAQLADLDGDGDLDIVVRERFDSAIAIIENLGAATFAPDVRYRTSAYPSSVAIGDYDGDGLLDIVVSCSSATALDSFRQRASGGFEPQPPIGQGLTRAEEVHAVDLDGDGAVDLVVARDGSNAGLIVLWNDGNGGFETAADSLVSINSRPYIIVGDFDGDGAPDLSLNGTGLAPYIVVHRGNRLFELTGPLGSAYFTLWALARDLDLDGQLDLVIGEGSNSAISFLRRSPNGSFPTSEQYSGAAGPKGAAIFDVDGDGDLDLVIADITGLLLLVNRCR